MDQIETREGARRQHRCIAMFCALYCWNHDKKAVFVQKDYLLRFLGLERLREKRMDWLKEDVGGYFPYVFRRQIKSENKDSIIFSRIPESELVENKVLAIYLKPSIFNLADYKEEIIFDGGVEAVRIIEKSLPFLTSIDNLHEFSVLNTLTLLANGSIDPKSALSQA